MLEYCSELGRLWEYLEQGGYVLDVKAIFQHDYKERPGL